MWSASLPRMAVPVAAALVALALAVPALAVPGLPRLGDLRAGPYEIALYNDSPSLVTGRNVLTLEVPAAVAGPGVQLELVDLEGVPRPVRLRRVAMLGGAGAGHGAEVAGGHDATADSHTAAPSAKGAAAADHGSGGSTHHGSAESHDTAEGTAPSTASTSDHGASAGSTGGADEGLIIPWSAPPSGAGAEPVLLRGQVNLPRAGTWHARVTVTGPAGDIYQSNVVALEAARGGPSRWYLVMTVTLVSIALLVGVAGRRRTSLVTKSKGR